MNYDRGNRTIFPYCHANSPHRTLVIVLASEDNKTTQVDQMRNIAAKFGDNIQVGYIKGHDVMQALQSMVMRSLNWPLPVITISEDECTYIMAPSIQHMLMKIKLMNNIKRYAIYGPSHLQGMGLQNLYTHFGSTHLSLLLQFYNTDTDLGRLLKISLECLSMKLGLTTCPFTYYYKNT